MKRTRARRAMGAFLLALCLVPAGARGDAEGAERGAPEIAARAAVLIDGASGRVLFGENECELLPMTIGLCAVFTVAFLWLTGAFGLMLGVLRPNFQWTSEAMPIKQSMNVLISIFLGFLIPVLAAVGCYLVRNLFSMELYMGLCAALFGGLSLALTRWLNTKGAARFDAL